MQSKNIMPVKQIGNRMALRIPQYESLQILDEIMASVDLAGDLKTQEKAIHTMHPIFKEFERGFPSLTFALATGVGKTRLMGAFMVYLFQNYGIKNFFIVAPNLTIYEKLKRDFGEPGYAKYVFKGLQFFAQTPPKVITGENFKEFNPRQSAFFESININIFNIGKINSEIRGGAIPQIKRLYEYIGESYFDYLKNLPDLVMLMDESHHYRAEAGFKVLNELDPLLGLELTATPQVETAKGAVKFRNVVYEYSLAQAIGNFVKTPWVATKRGFNARSADEFAVDKIKLTDGLIIHRNTMAELEAYALNEGVRVVKPFVLVVCKDTTHAAEIMEYIKSDGFFEGYYRDKVIEVHSAQKGSEKDENIRLLLGLEEDDNRIEIVVHVNMLKEGWDVTNLYTIIPLRVAASLTLREQTIGRGLRLPYGRITGNDTVDRLTIVAHDKFEEIIRAANDENSIIKKEHIIEIEDNDDYSKEKETVKSSTVFDAFIKTKEQQQRFARSDDKKKALETEIRAARIVGQAIEEITTSVVNIAVPLAGGRKDGEVSDTAAAQKRINIIPTKQDLVRPEVQELVRQRATEIAKRDAEADGQIRMDVDAEEINKKIDLALAPVIEEKIKSAIDIPNIAVVAVGTGAVVFEDFDLDSHYIYRYDVPSDDIIMENLSSGETEVIQTGSELSLSESAEDYLLSEVLEASPLIDYDKNKRLLYKIVGQMTALVHQGKSEQEFIKALIAYKKEIAREICSQMEANSKLLPPEYQIQILQFSTPIITENYTKFKADEVKKYTANIPKYLIKKTVFGGFSKACCDVYKFDSEPEQSFAIVLERSPEVLKWMRPALGQLPIHWSSGAQYQPDFIVETADTVYIIEIKDYNKTDDDEVRLKAKAAIAYCDNVNKLFVGKVKQWEYRLIQDIHLMRNSDFVELLKRTVRLES